MSVVNGVNFLPGADLSGQDFSNADFSGVDLTLVNLSGANLTGAIFDGALLMYTDFSGANLTGANFEGSAIADGYYGSDSGQPYPRQVDFTGADLSGANFFQVNLSQTNLTDAVFTNANLSGVNFPNLIQGGTEFNASTYMDYSSLNFSGANLSGAYLSNITAVGTNFNGADLRGAFINGGDFSNSNFSEVNLSNTNIGKDDLGQGQGYPLFIGVNFQNSDLSNTVIYADFNNANLTNVDFTDAHLTNMDLTGANLTAADLTNATYGANLTQAQIDQSSINVLEIYYDDNGLFKVHDLFLNAGETYSYQILDMPHYVGEGDTLVSASLQSHRWWDNPGEEWLTVTNDGLLEGTADFGYKDYDQGYNLILNYESGAYVNDYFQVYVNSYIETNTWSHDQNYNLKYDYDPLNVYEAKNLSLNLSDPNETRLELRLDNAYHYNPFQIIDQSGANITGSLDFVSGNLFKIQHSYIDGNTEGLDLVPVLGYDLREGGSVLSIQIQPNLYNGQSDLGPNDIFQVSLAQGVQTRTNDGTLTPLSDIIPSELIYQDTVAFEDKVSIDTSDRWDGAAIDTSSLNNIFNYSGIYINAGATDITHEGVVIPAYTSIAPDGTMLDISAISADGHGLEIHTSPLDDVVYVNGEGGDWPVVKWSAGDDYISYQANSGSYFYAGDYNDSPYGNQYSSEGLTFEFNAGILTVASEYGTTTAENVRNVYGTHGNDVFLGDENYQNFRGDGGYDIFTGGAGEDHFRLESQTENDPNSGVDVLIDSYARITDFENDDKISIEDYGFDTDRAVLGTQFSVTQNEGTNKTYISIATPEATINNMFEIDGIFYLDSFYTEIEEENSEINLRIKLTDEDPPNYIFGNDDDIDIDGTELVDWIYSNSGDKVINAYEGDDYIIQSGAGTHTYDGGAGNDTFQNDLSYATNLPDGFINEINLQTSFAGSYHNREHPSNDVITNIENVRTFGDIDHVLIGDVNDNILSSTGGNDIIRGGEGDDTLSSGAGNDFVYGEDGDDTVIQNGSGTQLYDGGEGIDTYVLDLEDWSFADDFVGEVNFTTNFSGSHLDPTHALNDQIYKFENITLKGDVDFIMIGDDNNNTIITDGGNDKLYGGGGNDLLSSGAGDDFVYGEGGNDTLILNNSGTQLYDGGEGVDTFKIHLPNWTTAPDGHVGVVDLNIGLSYAEGDFLNPLNDTLVSIENVTVDTQFDMVIKGNDTNNILIGGSRNDTLSSGDGDDRLFGGLGDDVLIINGHGDSILDGGAGNDTFAIDLTSYTPPATTSNFTYKTDLSTGFTGSKYDPDAVNNDDLINIENINYTGTFDADLTGDKGDNVIVSDLGDDILNGGRGNDILKSGAGNDFIYGESGNDILILNGSGIQAFDGGEGIDTFEHDFSAGTLSGDYAQVIDIDLAVGTTGQKGNNELRDSITNIEHITYRGSIDVEMTGDANNNIIKSSVGNDILYGGDGHDVLKSGDGDDRLYGDAGNDVLILNGSGSQVFDGGDGVDTFKIDHINWTTSLNTTYPEVIEIDLVNNISGQKGNPNLRDTLENIENITYRGFTDVEMTGDDNANKIRSAAGDDIINAGGGDDYINSGKGVDQITTGSGSDIVLIAHGQVSSSLETSSRITDFVNGEDYLALEGISFSDVDIIQGTGNDVSHTILSTTDASGSISYLSVLENIDATTIDASDFIENPYATKTLTASIDKWQLGDQTSSTWLDGPSMKLHRKDIADNEAIDLTAKDGHPGHKHKPDMDKGNYELRVEHNQQTDGAIDIDDVMGVLSLSRGKSSPASKEHKLAADWNGDGIIDIDDVMGVLARSRGKSKEDEWRFHDKTSDTSLWDNATKTNKMDIVLDQDDQIDLTAILRGDVNGSYNANEHNRAPDPSPAPTPNYAPLPMNNNEELLTVPLDIV